MRYSFEKVKTAADPTDEKPEPSLLASTVLGRLKN
jgi:hypothetical protein